MLDCPKDTGKWHTFLVTSDEEAEQKTAALKASPEWTEGDNLMVIRLVAVAVPEEPQNVPSKTAADGLSP